MCSTPILSMDAALDWLGELAHYPRHGITMIRSRKKLGKYLIERKIGEGGFASVYRAMDTIEGSRVALKILMPQFADKETQADFRKEVRLIAKLSHPNILGLKNAEVIDKYFVVAFPLGNKSLAQRLEKRLSAKLALEFTEQILEAVAHAHENRIIHCDIKPENLILFDDNLLKLTDFGIAKVAHRTVKASGSGTVGHVAPEQAMGLPSFRSDVFSIGLIVYRMFSGKWPEWPFAWPPAGFDKLRKTLHPDFISWLQRSMEFEPKKRFRDAEQMLVQFQRIKAKAIRNPGKAGVTSRPPKNRDWRTIRFGQFQNKFGKSLGVNSKCEKCHGPVSEPMKCCPWCGDSRNKNPVETKFPQCCSRCHRGMKLDWEYCPWCFGPGFEVQTTRQFSDKRYVAKCNNSKCKRKDLMPFMKYCPWCRKKVQRNWKIEGSNETCKSCQSGILKEFWNYCPWCEKGINE